MTFTVHHLTPHTLDTYPVQLQQLYTQFEAEAMTRYGWELQPISWQDTLPNILSGELKGVYAEAPDGEPAAMLLYRLEAHRVIEINMLFTPQALLGQREVLDALMRHALPEMLKFPDWEVLSFAMLGCQSKWIHTIGWYGFHPVGQVIVALDFGAI